MVNLKLLGEKCTDPDLYKYPPSTGRHWCTCIAATTAAVNFFTDRQHSAKLLASMQYGC